MYADDIVLLSTCPIELQSMIDSLGDYCDTWGLNVNLEKSKIIVFREGPRISSALGWTYKGSPIEIVNEYKYLGMLLTYNLSFRKHLQSRLATAKTSINATWSAFLLDPEIEVAQKLKIFEAAARSILFYGAQIWGFMEFEEVESLLRFFMKKILVLPKNTPNYMLHLETGIDSLYVSTLNLHFNYLQFVSSMHSNRLPHILSAKILEKKIFWASKWKAMFDGLNIAFPCRLVNSDLKIDHAKIVKDLTTMERQKYLEKARSSAHHDLYSELNYSIEAITLSLYPSHHIGLFIKARGGMLNLNANPL